MDERATEQSQGDADAGSPLRKSVHQEKQSEARYIKAGFAPAACRYDTPRAMAKAEAGRESLLTPDQSLQALV